MADIEVPTARQWALWYFSVAGFAIVSLIGIGCYEVTTEFNGHGARHWQLGAFLLILQRGLICWVTGISTARFSPRADRDDNDSKEARQRSPEDA